MKRFFAGDRRDLYLIALSLVVWSLGEGLFMIFQPIYPQELGADPIQIGFIISLSMVGDLIGPVPGGFLAERVGLRPLYFLATAIFVVSTLMILKIKDQAVHTSEDKPAARELFGNRSFVFAY